jgi:hypothetical protein
MLSVLDKCLISITKMIANLIQIDNAHFITNHPDFISSLDCRIINVFLKKSS